MHISPRTTDLVQALTDPRPSIRLRAALAAGTEADPSLVDVLIRRFAEEPDFFVRDMLTWALTRQPTSTTIPRLVAQLGSARPQARSQALHTLSKLGDRSVWTALPASLLHDADNDVARSAWRAAVSVVPKGREAELAAELAIELGRRDRDSRLSLSRALVALADPLGDALSAILLRAKASADPEVRAHAAATERLIEEPESGFALEEAKRVAILGPDRDGGGRADR